MSLDFVSPLFNPEHVLSAAQVKLPCENVQPLSNLAEYANKCKVHPTDDKRKSLPLLSPVVPKPQQKVPSMTLASLHGIKRQPKHVISMMETVRGPLARLQQCVTEKNRIKVWTRRAHEMRGVCLGYIVAFDKHWNIVLSDVDESYTLPLKTKSLPESEPVVTIGSAASLCIKPRHDGLQIPEHFIKQQSKVRLHQRHIPQLFIRGENVAFVSLVNCED